MRLIVVEDHGELAGLIGRHVRRAGFCCDLVATGGDALHALAAVCYDAMILDLGLPDRDGLSVLRELRGRSDQTPILILSARDEVESRIEGLNEGADDYLVKPFAMAELIARIRALLRRPGAALGVVLKVGRLVLDTVGMEARADGAALPLARRELHLLEELMRRVGRVVPKAALEDRLYGFGEEIASNAVEVHVHRLRRKLAESAADVEIHTVRGLGYLLDEQR